MARAAPRGFRALQLMDNEVSTAIYVDVLEAGSDDVGFRGG